MNAKNQMDGSSHGKKQKGKTVLDDKRTRLAYSQREVAEALGVSERTVFSWIKSGRLRAVKIDRTVRVPNESLLDLLQGSEE